MGNRRLRFLTAAALIVLTTAAVAFAVMRPWEKGHSGQPAGAGPVEVQGVIDLGPAVNSTIVPVPIKISNRGSTPITLAEFRTDCACIKLYQMIDQVKHQVGKLHLGPGTSETVYADLRISGDPGLKLSSMVAFRDISREAAYYQVRILYTPVACLYAIPRTAIFGEVPVDTPATQRVELRSDGTFKDRIEELTCSKPDLFSVRFAGADEEKRREFAESQPGQHLLGFIDINLKPQARQARIDEKLIILNGKEELCILPVSAIIVADYELSPSTLVLPRVSSGETSYSARVICRSRAGTNFTVKLLTSEEPFQINVDQQPDSEASPAVITVRYDGPPPESEAKNYTLRFKLVGPPGERELTLPVVVLPPAR